MTVYYYAYQVPNGRKYYKTVRWLIGSNKSLVSAEHKRMSEKGYKIRSSVRKSTGLVQL